MTMHEPYYLSLQRRKWLTSLARRYPQRRSIALPAVWAVQYDWGFIPAPAIEEIAEVVGITPAAVREIVTFYSMFREAPVGRYLIGVCGTLSCALCGAEGLLDYLQEKLGIKPGETTPDGLFSLEVMMCLGACAWAPAMLVNQRIHVRLTRTRVDEILAWCRENA
ncbi:MAG: NADH-quinone oxidoreductase subunit NuoE [Candidatus Sumerlaeia bacterium]|nr:NADH-quinone oxidoreductase subunit NuoE [Candidatus Sumerlaeia bacterium]